MADYIAFLRGINVGGIRIKMVDLKAAVEGLGYRPAKTYLQTGNVAFRSPLPREHIRASLEQVLTTTFHYEAFVHLLDGETLKRAAAGYPFERDDGHHAYLVFFSDPTAFDEVVALLPTLDEPVAAGEQVLYWKVVKGQSLETPLSKVLGKAKYKRSTTTRNLNTVEEVLADQATP